MSVATTVILNTSAGDKTRVAKLNLLILVTVLWPQLATAQSNLWQHALAVARTGGSARVQDATPSTAQKRSIATVVKGHDGFDCDVMDPDGEWLKNLRYENVKLSPEKSVLLVEAGSGCARGGQGANGAMWLIRFDGNVPTILASPEQGFTGFVYSVEPSASNGYRDIILGWHMGGGETGLTYLRFDRRSYRAVSGATLHTDGQGNSTIVLNRRPVGK